MPPNSRKRGSSSMDRDGTLLLTDPGGAAHKLDLRMGLAWEHCNGTLDLNLIASQVAIKLEPPQIMSPLGELVSKLIELELVEL